MSKRISDQTKVKYAIQEGNEIRRILRNDTVLIRQTTVFKNGLSNYELINAYGEQISTITANAGIEQLEGYEGIPIDRTNAKPYNAQATANAKYKAKSVNRLELNFFPADDELWRHLQKQQNKNGYIKELIRKDIEK